jgi:hypothetical protein
MNKFGLSTLGVVALIAVKLATHSGGFSAHQTQSFFREMAETSGQATAATEHEMRSIYHQSAQERQSSWEADAVGAGCKTRAEVDEYVAEARAAYNKALGLLR